MQSNTPVRLNIEQARKQAKDLLKALTPHDRIAARRFCTAIPQLGTYSDDQVFSAKLALHDAQRVIAIEHGCPSWPELVAHVQRSIKPLYSVDDLIGFFVAVKDQDADGVRRALDAHPTLIDGRLLDANYMLEGDAFREAIRNDPHPVTRKTRTALHLVSTGFFRQGTPELLEVARVLVERGADVNNVGWDGNNNLCAPIRLASWEGGLDMMRLLLDAGADVRGAHGVAALSTAARHNNIDRHNLLEEYGAPVSAWSLVEMGLTDRIIQLVERDNGLLTQRDDSGYTLLQTAAARAGSNPALMESGREIVRALVRCGAEMDAFTAAAMNDVDSLSRILDSDPGAADSQLTNGTSPVCFAVWGRSHLAMEMLLKAGADPNVSYGNAMSPLRRAAFNDDTVSCRLLLEHGAVPTDAAVNAAAWRTNDPECVKLLLDYGGNPNPAHDDFGAINWAAWEAQTDAVKALLDRGADPNHRAPAWAGAGPLHFAAFAGSRAPAERVTETIVALLDAGSDVNLVDENGNTPLDAAISRENHAAADLLREHGAKTGRELGEKDIDTTNAVRHWNNWFPKDRESFELTSAEEQFIVASIGNDRRNWVGTPDLERMEAILADEPQVLERIGSVLLHRLLLNRSGCGPAVKFMLDHGIALDLDTTQYNSLFDGVYMGAMDVVQTVFESGAADATCVSGTEAACRLAGQYVYALLGGDERTYRYGQAPAAIRRSDPPRASDQGVGRERLHLASGSRSAWLERGGPTQKARGGPHPHRGRRVLRCLLSLCPQRHGLSSGTHRRGRRRGRRHRGLRDDAAPLGRASRLHGVREDVVGTGSPRQRPEQGPSLAAPTGRRSQPGRHDTPARPPWCRPQHPGQEGAHSPPSRHLRGHSRGRRGPARGRCRPHNPQQERQDRL